MLSSTQRQLPSLKWDLPSLKWVCGSGKTRKDAHMIYRFATALLLIAGVIQSVSIRSCYGAEKLPIPTEEQKASAEQVVREAFGKETTDATSPQAKVSLANKMIKTAIASKDNPSGQYVLFRSAANMAIAAKDLPLAWQAVEQAAEVFDFKLPATKLSLLQKLVSETSDSRIRASYLTYFDRLMTESFQNEAFETAQNATSGGVDLASKGKDAAAIGKWKAKQSELTNLLNEFQGLKEARARAASDPFDRASHQLVGKFHCFAKNDWSGGLAYLKDGTDRELTELASLELVPQADEKSRLLLADSWWAYADRQPELTKNNIIRRAKHHYEAVLPSLTGLDAVRVSKRLDQIKDIKAFELTSPARVDLRSVKGSDGDDGKFILNSIGMKLVELDIGEFTRGSSGQEISEIIAAAKSMGLVPWYYDRVGHEGYARKVAISKRLLIGAYEVTHDEYQKVMPNSERPSKDRLKRPVASVTWFDAVEFCTRLSANPTEASMRRRYRLPTEAEWEYACRAGSADRFPFGKNAEDLDLYAWTAKNSEESTHDVGTKRPNKFGVYDMLGNVDEWCADWYDANAYKTGELKDPQGPTQGQWRSLRGGSFKHNWAICRSAARSYADPSVRSEKLGFRVVVEIRE